MYLNKIVLIIFLLLLFSCTSKPVGIETATETQKESNTDSIAEVTVYSESDIQVQNENTEEANENFVDSNLIDFSLIQKDKNSKVHKASSPIEEIKNANNLAVQEPSEEIIVHSQVVYSYQENFLYKVYTSPQRVTLLRLETGEKVFGEIVSGDTANWIIAKSEDVKRDIIYIKPIREYISTNIVINTNRRTYYLVLKSLNETYMVSVEWRYPDSEIMKQKKKHVIDLAVNIQNLNFGYKIVSSRKDPTWTPLKVFDDGLKTYIQFKNRLEITEKPVLFAIEKNKSSLVNYRVIDDYYIVDKVLYRAELRVGNKKRDSVKIVRLKK